MVTRVHVEGVGAHQQRPSEANPTQKQKAGGQNDLERTPSLTADA